MSLHVYLITDFVPKGGTGIFIQRNGRTVEISREEWDRAFPGIEPVAVSAECEVNTEVYSASITHNLGKMADAAGIYDHLWQPDEIGIKKAKKLIEPLEAGLRRLRADHDWFETYNPPNGWGTYDDLIRFVAEYVEACKLYPEANVSVWS